MLNLVRPEYFVPVHGEYRMLMMHGKLAQKTGVFAENVFVLEDGDVLEPATNFVDPLRTARQHEHSPRSERSGEPGHRGAVPFRVIQCQHELERSRRCPAMARIGDQDVTRAGVTNRGCVRPTGGREHAPPARQRQGEGEAVVRIELSQRSADDGVREGRDPLGGRGGRLPFHLPRDLISGLSRAPQARRPPPGRYL